MNKKSPDDFPNEDELVFFIKNIVPHYGAAVGIGDDAAVVRIGGKQIAVTTDSLVENVHFKSAWVTPVYLGKKAARTNLSDMAAMGARPLYALVSLVLPPKLYVKPFISQLYKGFSWAFSPHGVEIIGGNVSSGNSIVISLTLIGECGQRPFMRDGAQDGDEIFCTGILGNAAWEVSRLYANKKSHMTALPPDRVNFSLELAEQRLVTACMDISDSLAVDLRRICTASSVGALIREKALPIGKIADAAHFALFGGEDYELLFTLPRRSVHTLLDLAGKHKIRLTEIGRIVPQRENVKIQRKDGNTLLLQADGWDHLRK